MLSLLYSRFVLRFAVAGLSGLVDVLQPGRARCVVLVCRCRGRQWSARPGLCGGLYGPDRPCLVAVAVPYVICFPSGVVFRGLPGFGTSARVVVVLLPVLQLVRLHLRRPMVGLSCRRMHWAVVAV